ncbi:MULTISPECIES: hypothetical protein [Bacillus]|uniref:hypothetical protein n=1 Tax=Bacillus TaxID=1386 RepID=UPI001582874D|nr:MULTISPECIES: hypothetical protein [Bacillus]GIN66328.1 hypothetical protein J41TS2_17490 [Bacillus sonorensis]
MEKSQELQVDINSLLEEYDQKFVNLNRDNIILKVQNKELLKKVRELECKLEEKNQN